VKRRNAGSDRLSRASWPRVAVSARRLGKERHLAARQHERNLTPRTVGALWACCAGMALAFVPAEADRERSIRLRRTS
jgi:hypothetical protein